MLTQYTIRMSALCIVAASFGACNAAPAAPAPAATPAAPVVDTGKIADAVRSDVSQLVTELNARDVDKAVAHDAADMVGMFHGTPNVIGPAADKTMTEEQLKDPAFHLAVRGETVDVASGGDMAVYRATYEATITDPKSKKPVVEHGNWLIGYKPAPGGTWKIAWNIVSDTGPAAAAAK